MMMKNLIFFLALMGLFSAKTIAQEEDDRNDKVESMKIAFITDKLNLTPAEAQTFWPVFNQFSDELKKIKAKQKENMLTYKAKTNPTDQDANKFIMDQLASKQSELDLTKKYVTDFKKVLPEKKVARLLMLEKEFKEELLQKLKNRQQKMQR
jgi:hypothetical protein